MASKAAELVEYVAKAIVGDQAAVRVRELEGQMLELETAPDDRGRVIGRQGRVAKAMRLVLEHVHTRPGVRSFYTSYVPGPGCPEPLYRSLGFVPNGEVDDGEVVLVLPL